MAVSYVTNEKLNYFAQSFWTKCKDSFDTIGSAAQALTDAKAYADELKTAVDTKIGEVETALGVVEGDVAVLKGDVNTEGSVAYQIAQVVAGADASFDTLKEIADWIMSDTTGAAKLATDVEANTKAIEDLVAYVGTIPEDATATDVVGYIEEYVDKALTDSDLSQYAKAEDLEALEAVVGVEAEGENPATGLIADLRAVEEKAQANADAIGVASAEGVEATGINARLETLEGAVETLNGDAEVEGSVDNKIKAAIDGVNSDLDTVNDRLDALEIEITEEDIDDIIAGLQ